MRLHPLLALASLLVPLGSSRATTADAPHTPPPAAALAVAVARAPALHAAHARAEAARARAGAAGRLPDPEIEGVFSRAREPRGEDFPIWEINLRQPLPKAGARAADRDRAAAVVSLAEADYAVMAGEMSADVAMSLAEADAARARTGLFARQIERTERVLAALDARLASGSGRVADQLALKTRIASLRLIMEQDSRLADDALAEARGRLGLAPDAALPPFSAPSAAEIDPDNLPALRIAAAKAAEARAMARMARASARPMTSVGLRFEREEQSMGAMDTIGVSFMTEIPFRSRGYSRAEEQAARAEETAARMEAETSRHRARAAISRAERAGRLAEVSRSLADETAARLDAEYDSLLNAASASAGMGADVSILMVLEILERQTDTRLQIIEAEATERAARAQLWSHAPAALFATP